MNTKTYAWAALGLSLIVPNTLVSGEYSYGSKEVYESTGVAMFEETPYTVDLYGGGSTVYNSNTTQQSDGTSAWVAIFDFGFDVESGNQGGRGFDYGFGYDGAVYWWDNATAAADRDPFEHRLDGLFHLLTWPLERVQQRAQQQPLRYLVLRHHPEDAD